MISIIILTHNAPDYIDITLKSLKKTSNVEFEVIVLDNNSELDTKSKLLEYHNKGDINKLIFLDKNLFFAKGNNFALDLVDKNSEYILLLNSDVEIKDELWLYKLVEIIKEKKVGAVSFGYVMSPEGKNIADGYCYLVKKELLQKYSLNEKYEWWYGLPWSESMILKSGYRIIAIKNHEKYIHHFGGKSGEDWKSAKGMDQIISLNDVFLASCKKQVECIFDIDKPIGSNLSEMNLYRGISEDKWCTRIVDFEIMTGESGRIEIEGYYPFEIQDNIYIKISSPYKFNHKIDIDNFKVVIKTKPNKVARVILENPFAKQNGDTDVRELAFIIKNIVAY